MFCCPNILFFHAATCVVSALNFVSCRFLSTCSVDPSQTLDKMYILFLHLYMRGSRFAFLSILRAGATKCKCSRVQRAFFAMAHFPLFGPRSDLCLSPCQHQEASCASMAQWKSSNATPIYKGAAPRWLGYSFKPTNRV